MFSKQMLLQIWLSSLLRSGSVEYSRSLRATVVGQSSARSLRSVKNELKKIRRGRTEELGEETSHRRGEGVSEEREWGP